MEQAKTRTVAFRTESERLSKLVLIALALAFVFLSSAGCSGSAPAPTSPVVATPQNARATATQVAATTPGANLRQPGKNDEGPGIEAKVVEVVDGDTIKVSLAGKTETIRIIGIDTPEVVDPRQPVQCFGREASAKAKELLSGQQLRLVPDPTQADRDRYNRLLRYVEMADGTDFGLWMIANGYAHEYTYEIPYQRQAQYKAAYREAREKGLGFWAPNTCNGDTKKPAARTPSK